MFFFPVFLILQSRLSSGWSYLVVRSCFFCLPRDFLIWDGDGGERDSLALPFLLSGWWIISTVLLTAVVGKREEIFRTKWFLNVVEPKWMKRSNETIFNMPPTTTGGKTNKTFLFQFAATHRWLNHQSTGRERRNDIIYFPCWIIICFSRWDFYFRLALGRENSMNHLNDN